MISTDSQGRSSPLGSATSRGSGFLRSDFLGSGSIAGPRPLGAGTGIAIARSEQRLVPKAPVADLAAPAGEQERLEARILSEVLAGAPLPGLYPRNDEALARCRAATGVPGH